MFSKTTHSNPLRASLPGRAEPMQRSERDLYVVFLLYETILSG